MQQLGLIGLGRMGANMARRLARAGRFRLYGHDLDAGTVATLADEISLQPAPSLAELVAALEPPRRLWMMLPAGAITDAAIAELGELLAPGDLLVEGGNSYYRHTMGHGEALLQRGIALVDAGVSGGVWGLGEGYGLMLGGDPDAIAALRPVIEVLAPAPDRGWVHCGQSGSGHFVKMIHNGIEYGMMQSYAEGLNLLHGHPDFQLDLAAITESWRHGSVVRSWLLDLTADFLARDATLDGVAPRVAESGAGRWTVQEAVEQGVSAPVITLALMSRFASQGGQDYGARVLAMMRQAFGGHALYRQGEAEGEEPRHD